MAEEDHPPASSEPGPSAEKADAGLPSDSAPGDAAAPSGRAPLATTQRAGHPSFVFLGVVAALSLAADLGTKWWATTHLDEAPHTYVSKHVDVIAGYVQLVYARNKGGAWGLLQDENDSLRRPFFLLISVAAIVFIVSLYRKLNLRQKALQWGLPLVLGGALGNLVDRIRYGHVVDFIDAYYRSGGKEHHWPTFNVADVAICVGVGLMAIDMFTAKKPDARKAGEPLAARAGEAPKEGPAKPAPRDDAAAAEPSATRDAPDAAPGAPEPEERPASTGGV